MVILIFAILQAVTYLLFKISSPDGYLSFFALWSMITLGIFLFNAFNLPPSADKPYTEVDSLDYLKAYTGDQSIHNSLSIHIQYLIIFLLNIVITSIIWFTQF